MNSLPAYKIYPSLLDSFQDLLDSDKTWEKFYGSSEEPALSPLEYEQKMERELIDKVNRVPFVSEAASKGTAFNEIVDCIVLHVPATRDDCKITLVRDAEPEYIQANIEDFEFHYSKDLCSKMARYYKGAIPQYRLSAMLPTKYGIVELYGNSDYLLPDSVHDLKTTKNYDFGKFEDHWQRYAYPYCLIESGDYTEVKDFTFDVLVWKEIDGVLDANIYTEVYAYDHRKATAKLTLVCEQFIAWLELHRSEITDKKIFGGE